MKLVRSARRKLCLENLEARLTPSSLFGMGDMVFLPVAVGDEVCVEEEAVEAVSDSGATPTSVLFTEADGDVVGVSIAGAGTIEVTDANGKLPKNSNAAVITVAGADGTSSLTVTVQTAAGDGKANIGDINASGLILGAINISGNVQHLSAGSVSILTVTGDISRSLRLDSLDATDSIVVGGRVGELDLGSGLNGTVAIDQDVDAVNIGTSATPKFQITQITNDGENSVNPVVNGGKIAFISINNTHKTDLPGTLKVWDGTQLITVAEGASQPSLSGEKVAFVHGSGANGAIFLATLGQDPVQITNGNSPWLSGNKIAFVRGHSGDAEIFLIDTVTGVETQVTSNETEDSDPLLWGNVVTWVGTDPVGGDKEIYMLKDGQIVQVTNNDVDDTDPHGPPNFLMFVTTDPVQGDKEIALYDGFSVRTITDNAVDDLHPTYSCVAYQSGTGDDAQIYYWNKVTPTLVDKGENSYLSAGLIAYQKWDGEDYEIYLARVVGSGSPNSNGSLTVGGNLNYLATGGSLTATSNVSVGGDVGILWMNNLAGSVHVGGDMLSQTRIQGNLTGSLDADGDLLGQISINGSAGLTGSVTADGMIADLNVSLGDLAGTVTAHGNLGLLTVNGSLTGDVSTDGLVNARTYIKGNLAGDFYAEDGFATNITIVGSLTGSLQSGDDIGMVVGTGTTGLSIGGDLSGTVTAADQIISCVTVRGTSGITDTGVIGAGGDIRNLNVYVGDLAGTVTAHGNLGYLTVNGNLTGNVATDGFVNARTYIKGNLSGDFYADDGFATNITVNDLTGSLRSGGDIGVIVGTGTTGLTIYGNLSGKVDAEGTIVSYLTVRGANGITSTGELEAGGAIKNLNVTVGDLAGTVTAHGNLGYLTVNGSLTGHVATDGVIDARTYIKGDLDGDLFARHGIDVSVTVGGNLDGSLRSGNEIGAVTGFDANGRPVVTGVSVGGDMTGLIDAEAEIISNIGVRGVNGITTSARIEAGGDILGNISVNPSDMAGTIHTEGRVVGNIWANGNISGQIESSGNIVGKITNNGEISGSIHTDGSLERTGQIWSKLGITGFVDITDTLAGTVSTSGVIDATIHAKTVSGAIAATGSITGDIAVDGAMTGKISTNGDIAGTISAGGDLTGSVWARTGISGHVLVGGNLGGCVSTSGAIGGEVQANSLSGTIAGNTGIAGAITISNIAAGSISAGNGDLSGDVNIGGDSRGNIWAKSGISGDINVGANLMGNLSTSGVLSGEVSVQGNLTGYVGASAGISGQLLTSGSVLGKISTCGDLTGQITVGDDLAGTIYANRISGAGSITIADDITASGQISVKLDVATPGLQSITIGDNVAGKVYITGVYKGTIEVGNSILAGGYIRATTFDRVEVGLQHDGGTIQKNGAIYTLNAHNGTLVVGGAKIFGGVSYLTTQWTSVTRGANL